ncbi:Hypothetical protein SRAE_2000403500 [Strongyloides ratti]|uniref:Uncharacterized protein n=1 Tax=Strongyloides ratti TaxID=34506 RepID=A0A090LHU2_STRRB|nr:Hypothetical protein SRAE_2000403500 [Strongyloides ratti]CEF69386.1 Hypothetical protein SRAE_2000403500 [Strongyloides ratti]
MENSKTPEMKYFKYSSIEDVHLTTPKSAHRALDGKVAKSNTRSRLRKNLITPRKLFDDMVVNQVLDHCNVIADNRNKTTSCSKKEDNDFIDLRCLETFLDEPTYGKFPERENIDQLNNLLNYMEDLTTKDVNEGCISFRKNCTPPSRAGERRNGGTDYSIDSNAIKRN